MDLVGLLVALLIFGLVFAVIFWLLQQYVVPALPAPLGKLVIAIAAIIAILLILGWVFGGLPSIAIPIRR